MRIFQSIQSRESSYIAQQIHYSLIKRVRHKCICLNFYHLYNCIFNRNDQNNSLFKMTYSEKMIQLLYKICSFICPSYSTPVWSFVCIKMTKIYKPLIISLAKSKKECALSSRGVRVVWVITQVTKTSTDTEVHLAKWWL